MSNPDEDAAPARTVLVIGFFTAAFTILGSLEAVVEFASLAFIVVFGAMSALVLADRDESDINVIPPLIARSAHLFHHAHAVSLCTASVGVLARRHHRGAGFTAEAVYFERESIEERIL